MTSIPPREPRADLRQAAGAMHELFTALLEQGFTEAQALHIVGVVVSTDR